MLNLAFITKLLKFGVVGFSGILVDFGVTYLLKEKIRIHRYFANSLGFATAATTNYLLNRVWTFSSTNPDVLAEYAQFFAIALIGLLLNNLIVYLLSDLKFKINFYIAKGIATIVVFLWNFTMNYLFTFA
jgi:putative flippase GtrA